MLFSAYRRDDFTDAEGFVAQLGVILSDFPGEVVTYVTSPQTGLQRRSKWPPTISEVLSACEEHQDFLAKARKERPAFKERLPAPLLRDRPQGYLATIFVPAGHHRYARLVEWTKDAKPMWWKFGKSSDGREGIWVASFAWEGTSEMGAESETKKYEAKPQAMSAEQLAEHYARHNLGFEPKAEEGK